MIYLLSDLHGSMNDPGIREYLSLDGEDDLLLILGDICLNFENTDENRAFTDLFMSTNKKIAFLDGNHENFDYLYSFPEEMWNGGKIHRLTDHIVHLERGNIFTIEGKTFFVFGGCKSSEKWKDWGLWYPQEEATDEEFMLAYESLEKYNYKVDYILTHKYPKPDEQNNVKLRELIAFIEENVTYHRWYSGHWHKDRQDDEKHFVIYNHLRTLG